MPSTFGIYEEHQDLIEQVLQGSLPGLPKNHPLAVTLKRVCTVADRLGPEIGIMDFTHHLQPLPANENELFARILMQLHASDKLTGDTFASKF